MLVKFSSLYQKLIQYAYLLKSTMLIDLGLLQTISAIGGAMQSLCPQEISGF